MIKLATLLLLFVMGVPGLPVMASDQIICWFPPDWENRVEQADSITRSLSRGSGIDIKAKVAESYPEILKAFATQQQNLVYTGSFVQSIIAARQLGKPLLQNVDGHEMYAGILIVKEGVDPVAVLIERPERIAYTIGASSGESSAKAATAGRAAIGTNSHAKAVFALLSGKADGAFVKDWWWEANRERYPRLEHHSVSGVSIQMNPDDVLTASNAVSKEARAKIKLAAMDNPEVFGKEANMQEFSFGQLAFPLGLMKKGRIDPLTYSW